MTNPNDNRQFLVQWTDGPDSGRSGDCIGFAEVREQLRLLATSEVAYTRDHQAQIVVVEYEDTDGYTELRRFTPTEFLAHADEQDR